MKPKLLKLEEVPEALRGEYTKQEDGTYLLKIDDNDEGWGIDKLGLLRGKIQEALRDKERASHHLDGLRREDGTLWTGEEVKKVLEDFKAAQTLVDQLKGKDKDSEGRLQLMVAEAKRPLEKLISDMRAQNDTLRSGITKQAKTAVRERLLAMLKPQERWASTLRTAIDGSLQVSLNDAGETVVRILDDAGQPRMSSRTGEDGYMSEKEWSETLRKTFADCLVGDQRRGVGEDGRPGDPPGHNGRPPSGNAIRGNEGMTLNQYEALRKEHGAGNVIPHYPKPEGGGDGMPG